MNLVKLLLVCSLFVFTSCAHLKSDGHDSCKLDKGKHSCCVENKDCKSGNCKADKSCCKNKCGSCTGKKGDCGKSCALKSKKSKDCCKKKAACCSKKKNCKDGSCKLKKKA